MMKWFKRKKKEEASEPAPENREPEDLGQQGSEALEEDREGTLGENPVQEALEPGSEAVTGHGDDVDEDVKDEASGFGVEPEGNGDEDTQEDSDADSSAESEKSGFFKRLRQRLHKTREQFVSRVDRIVLGKKTIDADLLDDLEEVLITSDLGVRTTQVLLQKVADRIRRKELKDPQKLRDQLREEIKAILSVPSTPWDIRSHQPFVLMVIGVNGVGKTTTIGKLAQQLKRDGFNVILGAADTFRAAAIEQLSLWGERVGVPVIKQKSGSDPSAVAFDTMDAAASRNADVVILDTAGRMHTKVNLMEELKKVHRVVNRKMETAPHEILLVLDATTGQNALSQAKIFKEAIGLTGLVLTKLDGTAKGGIIVAICEELQVPVRYIGIGESVEDLRPFDPEEFTNALF